MIIHHQCLHQQEGNSCSEGDASALQFSAILSPTGATAHTPPHLDERHEVLGQAVLRQLAAHFAQRLDGPVAHHRLLHGAQGLEQGQQQVSVGRAAHVGHELAQLLRRGQQHLVLVIGVLHQERDELRARALLPQGQGNGGQPGDAVQPPHRLIALQLISAEVQRSNKDGQREGVTRVNVWEQVNTPINIRV